MHHPLNTHAIKSPNTYTLAVIEAVRYKYFILIKKFLGGGISKGADGGRMSTKVVICFNHVLRR